MEVFKLSTADRKITVDLGATGLSIPAMALEIMGLGETKLTSISQPDIQEVGSDKYDITFSTDQVNKQGFLLFSLTGTGFTPFIGILFTLTDKDLISGVPPSKEAFLPVKAFNGTTPVTGLVNTDFDTFFQRSDETGETQKTLIAADIIEPLNEFSVARGIYLVRFVPGDLTKIGDFDYRITQGGATTFDDFSLTIQVAQAPPTAVTFEVRDSSPDLTIPGVLLPTSTDLSVFIATTSPVNRLSFRFSKFGLGYVGLVFEYFNGTSFVPLTVADGTVLFTKNGDVTWTLPGDQSTGGTGTPNQTDYFIKISATAVASSATIEKLDVETFVEGVTVSVLEEDGTVIATGLTSDLGQFLANLTPATYTVILQKSPRIFTQNNFKVRVLDTDELGALGITDQTQKVILEGSAQLLTDPSVDPSLVLLKTDLVNLSGNPVQRQGIRLEHKFLPVTFNGSRTILGRTINLLTDDRGHAEVNAVGGALVDIFLTNTHVSRQIKVPDPRTGTGDTVDAAPTTKFKSLDTLFQSTDVRGIITINGVDHVITLVVDTTNIEVSPAIPGVLVGATWSIKKIDMFSLIAVAPDQFQVAKPTFDAFAIRMSLP